MATYVIYDRTTGKPVATHIVPDEVLIETDELLREHRAEGDQRSLEVLAVDPAGLRPGLAHRVNHDAKTIEAREGDGADFGGGGGDASSRVRQPKARVEFKREGPILG